MRIPAQLQVKLSPVLASPEWGVIREYLQFKLDYLNVRLRSVESTLMYRCQGEVQLLAELLKLQDKVTSDMQEREIANGLQ